MAPRRRLFAIVLLALTVAACDLLETPAFFKLDPSDTTWALVKIDGRETLPGGGAAMNVVGLDDVVFETRCRTITAGLVIDTDGSGWGVVDPISDPSTCTNEESAAEQASVDAFLAANEWRVVSDTEIELLGPHVLTFARLGAD